MNDIFRKLNLKDQHTILVIDAPQSFEPHLASLPGVEIKRDITDLDAIDFSLAFITQKSELDRVSALIAPKARGDATLWFAYPKGSSKNYTCDFNRDNGWDVLESHGFRGIRQVAIDQDWSALRFRRTAFIKVRS